ncbi:MAG: HlyD family efflux transporter periplasmic adaptor subunit [Phycisphaerae bacterium]
MAKPSRIPTPWRQRWRRIRYRALPVMMFLTVGFLAIWLWGQHLSLPNATGEVGAVRVEAVSPSDGRLLALASGPVHLYDKVRQGQVVARLDPGPSEASLATLEEELARLKEELQATAAQVTEQQEARFHAELAQKHRLEQAIEQLQLDIQDRKTLIRSDEVELERLKEKYDAVEALYNQGVESRLELVNIKSQRDVIQKRLEGNREALAEARQQLTQCQQRLRDYRLTEAAEMKKILAPLRAAVETQKKRIDEVRLRIENLLIRAPLDGVVAAIHKWGGQNVLAGDPVLSIASTDTQYILSYVREDMGVKPRAGMPVEVSVRNLPRRTARAEVEEVGPQVEIVPPHQLRDPQVPEWGLPVRITVPEVLDLRPGELVDVTFRPGSRFGLVGAGGEAAPEEDEAVRVADRRPR